MHNHQGTPEKLLYDRLRVFSEHFVEMRKGIEKTLSAYNQAVGSFEGRVLVTARQFQELGAGSGTELPQLQEIEKVPRQVQLVTSNAK